MACRAAVRTDRAIAPRAAPHRQSAADAPRPHKAHLGIRGAAPPALCRGAIKNASAVPSGRAQRAERCQARGSGHRAICHIGAADRLGALDTYRSRVCPVASGRRPRCDATQRTPREAGDPVPHSPDAGRQLRRLRRGPRLHVERAHPVASRRYGSRGSQATRLAGPGAKVSAGHSHRITDRVGRSRAGRDGRAA